MKFNLHCKFPKWMFPILWVVAPLTSFFLALYVSFKFYFVCIKSQGDLTLFPGTKLALTNPLFYGIIRL